jgi:hypothetical protein
MLVLFVIFSVLFYLLVVHPTLVAERFAAAVKSGDFQLAESLLADDRRDALIKNLANDIKREPLTFDVQIVPRTLSDVLQRVRFIEIRFTFLNTSFHSNAYFRQKTYRVVAGVSGIKNSFHNESSYLGASASRR